MDVTIAAISYHPEVLCVHMCVTEAYIEGNSKDYEAICRMQAMTFSLNKSLRKTHLSIMIFTVCNLPWGLLKIKKKKEKHDHMLKIKVLI